MTRRRDSWNLLIHSASLSSLPWVVLGDFNDLLWLEDKRGGVYHPQSLMQGFRDTVARCLLNDIPLLGFQFTWKCGKRSDHWVQERLDIGLLLLIFGLSCFLPVQRFRFENSWLLHSDIADVIDDSWQSSVHEDILHRIQLCGNCLWGWSKTKTVDFKGELDRLHQSLAM
ncbi:hypothetical protein GH714_023119 [Hevea brasiliensis]|uniref:Endonuclease/exonuclease/phosphatase domain-containing protein n=1 Tax=Hevea brasiliensis TaxID=3981 RepID=A0A6A6L7K2_HEVBR|nr:hypothetical protein GH714_023119 [Hevea brasiliensis]